MSNPMENTDNENLAKIMQDVLKETRELRNENKSLRTELQKLSSQQAQDKENESIVSQRRNRGKRRTASKECQVIYFISEIH